MDTSYECVKLRKTKSSESRITHGEKKPTMTEHKLLTTTAIQSERNYDGVPLAFKAGQPQNNVKTISFSQ